MLTRLKSIFLAVGKKYLCFLLIQFSKIRITITVNPLRRLWFDVCSFWNNKNSGHWQVLSGLQNCWMCIVFVLCTMFLFVVFFPYLYQLYYFHSFVLEWVLLVYFIPTFLCIYSLVYNLDCVAYMCYFYTILVCGAFIRWLCTTFLTMFYSLIL